MCVTGGSVKLILLLSLSSDPFLQVNKDSFTLPTPATLEEILIMMSCYKVRGDINNDI